MSLCASACAVPLAPGYKIVKESREIRFVSGQPPELRIRARYTLRNSGTADLTFLDASLPEERTFGRTDLRVEVDGREVSAANLPAGSQGAEPDALRIPLIGSWRRGQKRQLSIEYTLRSPQDSGSRITIGENSFHLGSRGWYPELLPPKSALSPHPSFPKTGDFTVRVPADFDVLAGGASGRFRRMGNEIELRRRLTADDQASYVVAGHYAASARLVDRNAPKAIFWTLKPLVEDPRTGAEQIESVWSTLEKDFGPLDKSILFPHIVESPELRSRFSDDAAPAAVAFPGGALVNPAALALGINSDEFIATVTRALAHEWIGETIYADSQAAVGMGEGLPEYAAIVIDEASGGPDARRKHVAEFLHRYDEAVKNAKETPLGDISLGDAAGPRRIALAKAPLFFVALEDLCGEAAMRSGLAHLMAADRGRETGYADLRAALEEASNRDLAGMFRLWLNGTGIPEDFRQRYQGAAAGELARK